MDQPNELKALKDSLARDSSLMQQLLATEMWDCLIHQLDKMEAQATDRILNQSESMDIVNFWRGRLAAVRELRHMPQMIIGWAKQYSGLK